MPIKKLEHTGSVAGRFISALDELKKVEPDALGKVGISASYVSQIRGGGRFPTVDHLTNLVKHYGYSGTWLLTGKGDKKVEPENTSMDKRLAKIEGTLMALTASIENKKAGGLKSGHKDGKKGIK